MQLMVRVRMTVAPNPIKKRMNFAYDSLNLVVSVTAQRLSIVVTEKPDPPIQVEAHDPTSKSITVTWKAPDNDGGCPIQGYIVEKMEKDGDRYERVTPSLVPGFSYVVTGLKEEMEYMFRVRAENAAGVSEPSRSTQLVKAADPVGMRKCRHVNSYTYPEKV